MVARHNGLDLLADVLFGHDQVELHRFMCFPLLSHFSLIAPLNVSVSRFFLGGGGYSRYLIGGCFESYSGFLYCYFFGLF